METGHNIDRYSIIKESQDFFWLGFIQQISSEFFVSNTVLDAGSFTMDKAFLLLSRYLKALE